MGKNKWTRHVDHEGEDINSPGCMWGFIHALGYHNWHSRIKRKSLSLNDGRRHLKSNHKENLVVEEPSELEMLLDANESQFLVDKGTRKSRLPNKKSLKGKIKALIAEEMHKEKSSKQKKSGSTNQPKFQKTCPVHHIEPTEHDLHEMCNAVKNPIIFVPGNVENGANGSLDKRRINASDNNDTSLESKLKDHADVMEMLKVNKELFLEMLRETEVGYQNFSKSQLASKKKARLTKSGSYPVSHLSQRRTFKPSKLEDKKNEVWSSTKGERSIGGTKTRHSALSDYAKTLLTSLGLLDDDGGNLKLKKSSSFAFHSTERAVDNKENNEELVNIEEDKQGSTYDLFEDLNGYLHEEYKVGTDYESKSNGYTEIDGFDISKNTMIHRRSSSLNESMDRYTKLFEHSFRKDVNLKPSKSLRLTNEYEVPPSKPFRRIRSLSYSDSCSFLPNGMPGDSQISEWLSCISAESEREEKSIYASEETGCKSEKVRTSEDIKIVESVTNLTQNACEEGNVEVEDLSETIDEIMVFKGNSNEEEMKCNESILNDVVLNSENCPGDISSSVEFQISQGLVPKHNVDADTLSKADHRSKSYRKENADLCYVRDILEHSGFSSNFFQTTWYSHVQVLNPSIVQELESFWHQEQECCIDEFYFCCHHQLLFDLVNQVLVQIYERSFTYYPKALSNSCRVRPLLQNRMTEEVCKNVGTLLRLKPEQELYSIDSIVDQDLTNDDIWMNLQLESECLSLELEDMIFNDLLEELCGP